MKQSEEGAALLSVLLLVAVMAVLAAVGLERLKLSTRLATNSAAIDQARAYGRAAEAVAVNRIGDLLQRDANRTTLQGDWAGREVPFPIDGGGIATAQLSDGGNCFNLNATVSDDGQGGYTANPRAIVQFERLMQLLQFQPSDARRIAYATADWIDTDGIALPNGAEDSQYQGYRTANLLMIDPSELRAVAGMRPELYIRLRPFLCTLPIAQVSPININTLLPDQAVLLAMLVPGLDPARAKRVLDDRAQGGFDSVGRFWDQPALAGAPAEAKEQAGLTSRWFNLTVRIELAGAELEQHSLIDASTRPARLVTRFYGEPS